MPKYFIYLILNFSSFLYFYTALKIWVYDYLNTIFYSVSLPPIYDVLFYTFLIYIYSKIFCLLSEYFNKYLNSFLFLKEQCFISSIDIWLGYLISLSFRLQKVNINYLFINKMGNISPCFFFLYLWEINLIINTLITGSKWSFVPKCMHRNKSYLICPLKLSFDYLDILHRNLYSDI